MIQLVVGLNTDATEVVGIASFNPQDDAAEKWWLQIRDVTKDSPGFIPQGYQNVCDKRGSNRKTFANWCASVAFFVGVNQFDVCEDRSEDGYFFRNRKKTSFKASNHRPDWIRHLFHGADQTLITSRHVGKNWWQLPQTLDREQFSVDVAYIDPNSEPRSWKVVSNTELETFLSEILRLDLKMPTASTENKSTGESNKKNSPPLEVPLGEYGRFLKRYRILMGMSFKDLESQLKTTAPKYFNQSNQYLPAQSNLKRFEAGMIDEHQDLANLEAIFELYGFGRPSEMPGLMAEWLSAKPVNDHCIMYDHFEDPGRDNRKAVASEYKAPQQRLKGLDCSVLKYHLDPCPIPDLKTLHSQTGGLNENEFSQVPHSQQHQHMGDELVYCIDGKSLSN